MISSTKNRLQGFSLIELMCVVAIIAIMSGLAASFGGSLFQSTDLTSNLSNLATLMEQAKQAALAEDTYVWLGLAQNSVNGRSQLIAVALGGTSGQSSDLATSKTRPLTKIQFFNGINLDTSSYLALSGVDPSNADLSQTSFSFSQNVPGLGATTFQALEFKPDGEVSLGSSGKRYAGVGLASGPAAAAHHEPAGIQISLLTGRIAVYHP